MLTGVKNFSGPNFLDSFSECRQNSGRNIRIGGSRVAQDLKAMMVNTSLYKNPYPIGLDFFFISCIKI
jgi:hypothetical protein